MNTGYVVAGASSGYYSPQVLQTTKASSVVAELRICELFNRYYGELCQKSKLPDSGESSFEAIWQNAVVQILGIYTGKVNLGCLF